ncbi:FadR/GntR family transcriptional regulator [Mycobacterium sp. 050134]|uniref:FadR/GntR family transcriptional regulator n=1 Tax=Mycobacterium sp. 050134 TaxID=3096111 RepID=UPI002EDB8687
MLAQEIEQRIRAEGWEPGRFVGSESDLCATFGVGTAAVREAARILEARGVAKARRGPGGGLFVTQPERSLVTDAARRYLSHVGVDREELFEVWMALEQLAITKLARSIDQAGAKRLRDLLDKEVVDGPRSWQHFPNIHLEIARLSGNATLELFIRVLSELTLHTYGTEDPGPEVGWLHARDVEIVDAIIAGDAPVAQLHLRRFIAAVKRDDFGPAVEREEM